MAVSSAIFQGRVVHSRLRPRRHRLRYSAYWLLLDIDKIDQIVGGLRLFSRNRFNLFGLYDRDYGESAMLREHVHRSLEQVGIGFDEGRVMLLTMPRVLGYAFNPLSIYFCHRKNGSLSAIFYEVNNTFGQRHNYLIPVPAGMKGAIRQESPKSFYVSPFMGTDMAYSFSVVPPGRQLAVSVIGRDTQGPLIVARLAATRQELTDATLARAFCAYPLLTLKVIAGIYWEALLIRLKGFCLQHRPSPPDRPVTLGLNVEQAGVRPAKDSTNVLR